MKIMARLAINEDLNGIEISFEEKPEQATIDALKADGFRWHRAKKLWYAKQTPERLALAHSIAGGQAAQVAPAKVAKVETINLENLGANKPSLYGAELAKAIREDLKRRGVKGCTVRARRVTYDTGITVTITATAEDFTSLEEMRERFPFWQFSNQIENHGAYCGEGLGWIYSQRWEEMTEEEKETAYTAYLAYYGTTVSVNEYRLAEHRNDYYNLTTAFYNKICAVFKIANQWNYNHSDSMSDYFDVGYYLDIDIKTPEGLTLREEMTEAEREAYAAEIKAEEEAEEAALAAWKAEQEENRKRAEEAEKKRAEQVEIIANGSTVEDLDEGNQIYITNLHGGAGKECDMEELRETIASGHYLTEDALIVRKVHMTPEAFAAFCDNFLESFDFLANMGGTGSEDIRLDSVPNIYSMTTEQRESVKWYICNAVAVCVDGEIKLVCDPQGHSYSRYTFELSEDSETLNATTETEAQKAESEAKPGFYFPAPVADQAEAITAGEAVTVYQCDGWILNSVYDSAGTVASVTRGSWAQYEGVYINYTSGKRSFLRDGKKCLVYKGIKPRLPEIVTQKRINDRMCELFNAPEILANILKYYGERGERPLLDTVQR